ncbi:MAG: AraC family transcriptional regulator [Clostridia bacterium]|nr:AraC family transcriptional regulator [Clostridia bacterium]
MPVYSDEHIEFFDRKKRYKPMKMSDAHFHDKHELYYLEKGHTKYFIGNEIFLLEPGDLVFVPKGAFHRTDSDENHEVERLLFVFDDSFAGKEYIPYIAELINSKHVRLPKEQLYRLKDIFNKIESEDKKRSKDYYEMEKLYLRQMLILISRLRIKNNVTKFTQSYSIIQSAAKFISENCNGDLSLETLAAKYAMSPSHFSKQFKNVTGVGLNEYINISRISSAEKLLLSTDWPITRIATECGFNDSNYFAAVFKKIKGITPKKYSRQKH